MAKPVARLKAAAANTGRFLRQVVAELRRVVWPDRRQAAVFTAVVLGAVTFTALLVWAVDAVVVELLRLVLE